MRLQLLAAGLLALAGCQTEQSLVQPPRSIAAEAPPAAGLWLELHASTEHLAPVGHVTPIAWSPATWVISEGAHVEAGDPLARLDVASMQIWNDRESYDLQREDQRRRLDLLRADGEIEQLQSRLRQLQARRASVAAELADVSRIDSDEVRIAQLQLDDARREHAATVLRLERLQHIAAAGAPVSGSDLARAREEELRSRAALAAPQVTLELATLPAARSTVRRLQLTIEDLDAQLGATPADGLAAELRTAEERRSRRMIDRGQGDRRRRMVEKRTAAIAQPEILAKDSGTAVLRDPNLRSGSKLPPGMACIFVYGAHGLAASIAIPERQRSFVTTGSRVALSAPALAGTVIQGAVSNIATAPQARSDGQRMFAAVVVLDNPPTSLKPGMTMDVRLAVDAGPGSALVPSFCIADPATPTVMLMDGASRSVQGFIVGSWFVATAGLNPGEQVRLPDQATPTKKIRLSALVEPASFVPVNLRSWEWEVQELLPEGSQVHRGDRLARLTKVDWWRDSEQVRSDAEQNLAQSRLDLSVEQLSAADGRAAAQVAWVRARLDQSRARLAAWVGRNAYDAVGQARSEADLAAIQVGRDRAARELAAAIEERAAGGISDGALAAARANLAKSELALERARLTAASLELGLSLPSQRERDDTSLAAVESEEAKRTLSVLASESYRARIAGAAARFEGTRRWVDSELRNLADEEMFSPADGILVHGNSCDGPPRVGRKLETWEPFRIADGSVRRAMFEVPIRWFGRLSIGSSLRIAGPGVEAGMDATISAIGSAFLPPTGFADEVALGRTIGVENRIFQVTVTFTPAAPGQLPLGSSVHVDLQ